MDKLFTTAVSLLDQELLDIKIKMAAFKAAFRKVV
jgi:hypothetical protein